MRSEEGGVRIQVVTMALTTKCEEAAKRIYVEKKLPWIEGNSHRGTLYALYSVNFKLQRLGKLENFQYKKKKINL